MIVRPNVIRLENGDRRVVREAGPVSRDQYVWDSRWASPRIDFRKCDTASRCVLAIIQTHDHGCLPEVLLSNGVYGAIVGDRGFLS